jgi:hypothetical protein
VSGNPLDDDEPGRSRSVWLIGAAAILALALALVWWPGCRQYPPISSPEALQLMKLLYVACNLKDPVRLEQVEKRAAKLTEAGKLPPPEREAFERIVKLARAGDWEQAENAAYKFAEDQVGVGHSNPEGESKPPKKR